MSSLNKMNEQPKIDIVINVYGKPWQTLVSLKTLLLHSGKWIDKIYFIEERHQPYSEDVKWVISKLNYEKVIHYQPAYHLGTKGSSKIKCLIDKKYRQSIRYQYALEETDKKYLLIIHNDVLFESDIVGAFLDHINNGFAIGQIGQCWNCPMYFEELCDGSRFGNVNFSYKDAKLTAKKYPKSRTFKYRRFIDRKFTNIMPECRMNEWCCMINVDIYRQTTQPKGKVWPFGGYFRLDVGDAWFRGLVRQGYQPVHYNIYEHMKHGYFTDSVAPTDNKNSYVHGSSTHAGHAALSNEEKYLKEEQEAREIYKLLLTNEK
jgi:hypothetical protein